LVLLQQIWTFWWQPQRLPFPGIATLAERMGKTVRQIQHYLKRLRNAGLITVVERHDEQGRQLANAYDLRPLLAAIEVVAGQHTDTVGMQATASRTLKESSPERNEPEEDLDLDLPPNPQTAQIPGTRTLSTLVQDYSPEEELLASALAAIGAALHDDTPRSTRTRARNMQHEFHVEDARFLEAIAWAARRVQERSPAIRLCNTDGEPNGMPYFFAVLRRHLQGGCEMRRLDRRRRQTLAAASRELHRPEPVPPAESLPIWRTVLAEVRETLAPPVYARLCGLHASVDTAGRLVIEAPCEFERNWLVRAVSRHLEEALHGVSDGALRLLVTVAAA
jgi:hypothetical protein